MYTLIRTTTGVSETLRQEIRSRNTQREVTLIKVYRTEVKVTNQKDGQVQTITQGIHLNFKINAMRS